MEWEGVVGGERRGSKREGKRLVVEKKKKGPQQSAYLCVYDFSTVAADTHCGGRLEEDGSEHTHSLE